MLKIDLESLSHPYAQLFSFCDAGRGKGQLARVVIMFAALCSFVTISFWGLKMPAQVFGKPAQNCHTLQNEHCHQLMYSKPMASKYGVVNDRLDHDPHNIDGVPPLIQGLLDAPPMQSWPLPTLHRPILGTKDVDGDQPHLMPPFILMLHIFSNANEPREARDTVRAHSPLEAVPVAYRHLIEVKFVLGRSHSAASELALDDEQEEHGDLIRLDGLVDGDNLNDGKSFEWIRWVGREGGREAWWVL